MSDSGYTPTRKDGDRDDDGDSWLLTYSDAVTLLMTFLVLIISVSTIDQAKFEQVAEAIKEGALKYDAVEASPFEVLKQRIEEVTEENQLQDQVTVSRDPKGVTVEFASTTFYDVGSADLRPEAVPALLEVSGALRDFNYENYIVEVEGHTDNTPIHTDRYPSNWELSVHRATNIVRFLLANGMSQERLKAAGYADTRPKVPNLDDNGDPIPENQAMNRRIVVHVHRQS